MIESLELFIRYLRHFFLVFLTKENLAFLITS